MNDIESSWKDFTASGDFLKFSCSWENGIPNPRQLDLPGGLTVKVLDSGIMVIQPNESSSTSLLISSGIHGNETAPMEIVTHLLKLIWTGQLEVKVNLMIIIGNPPAVNVGKRFVGQNLNRLFSGKYAESTEQDYETGRAQIIEKAVDDFYLDSSPPNSENSAQNAVRYHFDLHTAIRASKYEKFVVYPYLDEKPWDKNHIAFFGGANINTVLLGNQPAGTFSYYTSNRFAAKSATVELGKVKPFGENDMLNFRGITENLKRLIEYKTPELLPFNNQDYRVFKVKQDIIKENEDFQLLLADDVKNFTSFDKGTLLASDGKTIDTLIENDGEAIVFPNNKVPVGQRVGVLLEKIEL